MYTKSAYYFEKVCLLHSSTKYILLSNTSTAHGAVTTAQLLFYYFEDYFYCQIISTIINRRLRLLSALCADVMDLQVIYSILLLSVLCNDVPSLQRRSVVALSFIVCLLQPGFSHERAYDRELC